MLILYKGPDNNNKSESSDIDITFIIDNLTTSHKKMLEDVKQVIRHRD